ncbi:MAG: hypothetical protein AAF518_08915 [Spirochaetota bacterium]
MRKTLRNGVYLGFVLAFVFLGAFLLYTKAMDVQQQPSTAVDSFSYYMLAWIVVLFITLVFSGLFMGYLALLFTQKRKRKLFLSAVAIYTFHSCLIAYAMIYAEPYYPEGQSRILGGISLGFMGAVLFFIFFVPILLGISFLLERWALQEEYD